MECADVLEAVRLGEESPDIYDHLAYCEKCRAKVENTQFIDGKDDPTDRRPPAMLSRRPALNLQLVAIVAGVLVPLLIIGTVALVVLRRRADTPPALTLGTPTPTVTPVPTPIAARPAPAAAPVTHKLAIDAQPPGTVYLDGKKVGETPYTAEVAPGRVLVEVRAEGYRTAHKVVPVGDEDPKPLAFVLQPRGASEPRDLPTTPPPEPVAVAGKPRPEPKAEPKPDPEPEPDPPPKPAIRKEKEEDEGDGLGLSGFGFLTITTDPKFAKVFIDGKDTGRTTPVTRLTTTAGKHKVELRKGTSSVTVEVTVGPRKEIEIDKELE
jgi:PEGA domain